MLSSLLISILIASIAAALVIRVVEDALSWGDRQKHIWGRE